MTTATLVVCKNCNREIKEGDLVKVNWNGEQDEHISCPAPESTEAEQEEQDEYGRLYSFNDRAN